MARFGSTWGRPAPALTDEMTDPTQDATPENSPASAGATDAAADPMGASSVAAPVPGLKVARPSPAGQNLRQQLLRQVVADNAAGKGDPLAAASAAAVARTAAAREAGRRAPWLRRAAVLVPAGLALLLLFWQLRGPGEQNAAASSAASGAAQPAALSAAGAGEAPPPVLNAAELKPISADVFGLGIHRILLDPGHGGTDTGTTVGQLAEKDLPLDIATRLREQLEKEGFEVHMTRTTDLTMTLRERSEMANLMSAHLFVSVHINYLPGGRSSRGVETYFVGSTEDPELLELARRENAHSGYDMASNNQLLQKLFTDARKANSQVLAQRVQQMLFSSLKRENPELIDRGVKQAPFVVLVGTTMPAILAEVACLSNDKDAELLGRPLYRASIAEALARGIRRYAEEVNPSQEKGS